MSRPYGSASALKQRRRQAVQAVQKGNKVKDVARILGVHPRTVFRWLERTEAKVLKKAGPDNPRLVARAEDFAIASGVVPGVVTCDIPPYQTASISTFPSEQAGKSDVKQTAKKLRPGASLHRAALFSMSEDDGTRTRNHRIDSPLTPDCKPLSEQHVTASDADGRTTGRTSEANEGGTADPELARIIAVWDRLPDHVRQTILTIADAALLALPADDRARLAAMLNPQPKPIEG